MSTGSSDPKCDRCQTPMERYAVPGTGGKEQAWRLACPCQHSATPDVARASNANGYGLLPNHQGFSGKMRLMDSTSFVLAVQEYKRRSKQHCEGRSDG